MRQSTKNTIPISARLMASIMHTGSLGGCLFFIFDIKTQCLQLGKRLMLDDLPLPVSIVGLVLTIDAAISAIFALRGYRFKNRLIYPFIRDE
jgi:hypothetical protein